MGEMSERVSPILLNQHVRNRIIEYLELAESSDAQRAYQAAVSSISVPNEIINHWEDWASPEVLERYTEPVFSPDEQEAVRRFHAVWSSVVNDTPAPPAALTRPPRH